MDTYCEYLSDDTRASDARRKEVLGQLRKARKEGCLTSEQFIARSEIAVSAAGDRELAKLISDLPHWCGSDDSRNLRTIRRKVAYVLGIMILMASAAFGIYALISWVVTTPPLTITQSYHDGYADGLSNYGYNDPPWGDHSCVTDWNGQIVGAPYNAGFSNGGPVSTHLITYADQNTESKLGNAWMAGCRAALKAEGM